MSHGADQRGPHSALIPANRASRVGKPLCIGAPASEGHEGPSVELVREGDVIRAIDITCSCGERIRVHCKYD